LEYDEESGKNIKTESQEILQSPTDRLMQPYTSSKKRKNSFFLNGFVFRKPHFVMPKNVIFYVFLQIISG
jgi:hypothetical protein